MKFEFDKYEIPNSLKVYTLPTEANNGQILETSYNPEYIVVNGVTQSATYSFNDFINYSSGPGFTFSVGKVSNMFYDCVVTTDGNGDISIVNPVIRDRFGNVITGMSASRDGDKVVVYHNKGFVLNCSIVVPIWTGFIPNSSGQGNQPGGDYISMKQVCYSTDKFKLIQYRSNFGQSNNFWNYFSFTIENINNGNVPELGTTFSVSVNPVQVNNTLIIRFQ